MDITTSECIESAYAHAAPRLRKQISQTGFLRVWKVAGKTVGVTMREKNGVAVPGLGTFTFRANGSLVLCLMLSPDSLGPRSPSLPCLRSPTSWRCHVCRKKPSVRSTSPRLSLIALSGTGVARQYAQPAGSRSTL